MKCVRKYWQTGMQSYQWVSHNYLFNNHHLLTGSCPRGRTWRLQILQYWPTTIFFAEKLASQNGATSTTSSRLLEKYKLKKRLKKSQPWTVNFKWKPKKDYQRLYLSTNGGHKCSRNGARSSENRHLKGRELLNSRAIQMNVKLVRVLLKTHSFFLFISLRVMENRWRLRQQHGPVLWRGSVLIAMSNVSWCKGKITTNKTGALFYQITRAAVYYRVLAVWS